MAADHPATASTPHAIYTVGHGNRAVEELIALLQRYDLHFLLDVRSQPYSRYAHWFSKNQLEVHMRNASLKYVYMGDALGGRPDSREFYKPDDTVDYDKLSQSLAFQQGIERLHKAWEGKHRVCLLCSELRPEQCHRSKLIAEVLVAQGIPVLHIDEVGGVKVHADVMQIVRAERDNVAVEQMRLLPDDRGLTSRKKYAAEEQPDDEFYN